jgi:hypothetical protein
MAAAWERLGKHVSAAADTHVTVDNCWKRCFLRGPCRDVVTGTVCSNELSAQLIGGEEKTRRLV